MKRIVDSFDGVHHGEVLEVPDPEPPKPTWLPKPLSVDEDAPLEEPDITDADVEAFIKWAESKKRK